MEMNVIYWCHNCKVSFRQHPIIDLAQFFCSPQCSVDWQREAERDAARVGLQAALDWARRENKAVLVRELQTVVRMFEAG